MDAVTGGLAWVEALLRVERALAAAEEATGLIPPGTAERIGRAAVAVATARVPAQMGGAVGTLSALGDKGAEVVERFAAELELPAPSLPWHTNRAPIAGLGAALGLVTSAAAKVAGDITLLAQTEVG